MVTLEYTKCSVNIDTTYPLFTNSLREYPNKYTKFYVLLFFVVVDTIPYALKVAWLTC